MYLRYSKLQFIECVLLLWKIDDTCVQNGVLSVTCYRERGAAYLAVFQHQLGEGMEFLQLEKLVFGGKQ